MNAIHDPELIKLPKIECIHLRKKQRRLFGSIPFSFKFYLVAGSYIHIQVWWKRLFKGFSWCFVCCFLLISCQEDLPESSPPAPFVGQWVVLNANLDAVLRPAWSGVSISFEQDSTGAGTYQVADTPIDSVWARTGKWSINADSYFIREDSLLVDYYIRENSAFLSMFHPGYIIPCVPDSVTGCPLGFTGQWNFNLQKIK